ncbi:hypothetical protein AB0F18_37440 [Streptomyces sp. NPDC029216]|uniref:hypothetical protein n=1 Tax=Streptomyces sp. NPDC029216 TaxID=3154701 RepID=UPI0033CF347E
MYEINGVNATPGGRTTVRFHDQGYAVQPDVPTRGEDDDTLADKLFGEGAGCITAVVLLASIGLYSLLRKSGAPDAALAACVWVFVAALCYGALIALLHWTSGVLSNIVFFLVVVVMFPALLIPGYRRAVRRRWGGGGGGPVAEPVWIPATALAGVWHQPDPRSGSVVTIQHTDGSVVAFVPPPDRAHDLYARFDALLRSARHHQQPAVYHHQQQPAAYQQPWQGGPPQHPGYHHPRG